MAIPHIADRRSLGGITAIIHCGGGDMRTCNHIYSTVPQFREFLEENVIDCTAPMFVRIHTAVHDADGMRELLKELKLLLPQAEFIGCSSPAVILNGRKLTEVCMISVTTFTEAEECSMASASIPCFVTGAEGEERMPVAGDELAMQVVDALSLRERKGQLLVFMPENYFQASRFAETIDKLCPDIRIIGGIANDQQVQFSEEGRITEMKFTISTNRCCSGYLAAAVLSSPKMRCFEGYALGMEKISGYGKITSCKGNIIYSAAGRTPYGWLQALGGDNLDTANLDVIRIFPLVRKKNEVCAWPMAFCGGAKKQDAVMIMDDIEEGEEVALGYLSPSNVVDDVNRLYRNMKKEPSETVFAYSCTLRAEIMQNCSEWEQKPLKHTTASGAFLGGEFFYDGSHNRFGNCTFVVSSLAVSDEPIVLDMQTLTVTHSLYHDNEHLIDFLTMSAAQSNKEENFFYREMKSRLYNNKEQRLGRLTKLIYDIQVHKINKLCLIYPRNCSEMIAYAGYRAYDRLTSDVLERMQDFLKDYHFWYYLSDQGELMVSANDDVTGEEFEQLMHKLYRHLVNADYYRIQPIYDFSLVLNEKNLLRCAKVVQTHLHDRMDQHFLVYSKEMGMEEKSVRDVHMVHVINDAIANGGVMPYYQGIHDNQSNRIVMYEALMRLRDTDGNMYSPGDFIPVAKKYGLYNQLSRQMIAKVMAYIEEKNVLVTMNISVRDTLDPMMTELIYTNMKNSAHPENYVFEVVETEEISDPEAMAEFVKRIHEYGGKIALDDFGSGFSNLVRVISLELDFLKVDGEIVKKICDDSNCRRLLEMLSLWCRMTDKKIIAEFVENDAIQKLLCAYHIDYSQGYLFSKPKQLIMFDEV